MTIEHRKGNLFDTDIKLIVHGCNAHGVMGSGVAKIVRDDYPEAYEQYKAEYELARDNGEFALEMGSVGFVKSNGKVIGNAVTQYNYGGKEGVRYVDYEAVSNSIHEIIDWCLNNGHTQFAMPKIGAGLGGGNWDIIEMIIADDLRGHGVHCVVYTHVP
jgi:O-acetyl-ADP-ribose deacetylase (regulator of RNase III)